MEISNCFRLGGTKSKISLLPVIDVQMKITKTIKKKVKSIKEF